MNESIAIIGAGMAGLACARRLVDAGRDVQVFEKSRGSGGRMASRREHGHAVDIGAQYFTARSPIFEAAVARWARLGVVSHWAPKTVRLDAEGVHALPEQRPAFVGTPHMSALTRHLASGLPLNTRVRILHARETAEGWLLKDLHDTERGPFGALVIAVPAPQAIPLLTDAPRLAAIAEGIRMRPCWTAWFTFEGPMTLPWQAAHVEDPEVAWLSDESSKPEREGPVWLLQATPAWSLMHLEAPSDLVAKTLGESFARLIGRPLPPHVAQAHCWRHGLAARRESPLTLWDQKAHIGLAGDWLVGGRVEAAWSSGTELANVILSDSGHLIAAGGSAGPTPPAVPA